MSFSSTDLGAEWLEADGLGGFASGTVGLERTRRYHALLIVDDPRSGERWRLVAAAEAWLETPGGRIPLSQHRYAPGVSHPDGAARIVRCSAEPWPNWIFQSGETRVHAEVIVQRGEPGVTLRWRVEHAPPEARLVVRPMLSVCDYHALHRENGAFRFDVARVGDAVLWRPYEHRPGVAAVTDAPYRHAPLWFRSFLLEAERERGFDHTEDLASPGEFIFDLVGGVAAIAFAPVWNDEPATLDPHEAIEAERLRRRPMTALDRAAETYLAERGGRTTIVAGYPWFTDWGRDTFIALRGLCLATGRLDDARRILLSWAPHVDRGMLPNRFPDGGAPPEFNAVDASLWFVVAAHEFAQRARRAGWPVAERDLATLADAVQRVVSGYAAGSRHGVRVDDDGLLASGEPGVQLTWMDAKIGDWVVTPRTGKAVEIQALWLNALWIAERDEPQWADLFGRALRAFRAKFWNLEADCLFDVIDVDHRPGVVDASIRPNQILAVGGLPLCLLGQARARSVVDVVERDLLTPAGLRSLAPSDAAYRPRYAGGPIERDSAYHQGTVWPWLLGPFVEAWLRTRRDNGAARAEIARRFLEPLRASLRTAGLGHVSEIADADPPHTWRGCPFQAWSLAELLRLERVVLAETPQRCDPRVAEIATHV